MRFRLQIDARPFLDQHLERGQVSAVGRDDVRALIRGLAPATAQQRPEHRHGRLGSVPSAGRVHVLVLSHASRLLVFILIVRKQAALVVAVVIGRLKIALDGANGRRLLAVHATAREPAVRVGTTPLQQQRRQLGVAVQAGLHQRVAGRLAVSRRARQALVRDHVAALCSQTAREAPQQA